jgi:hypothetical protein
MQRRRNWFAWLGLGLGVLGCVSYFAWVIIGWGPRAPMLRDTALLNLACVGVGLGFSVIAIRRALGYAATHGGRAMAPLLGLLNLGLAVLFLLMLFRFAALPAASGAPQVGQAAPDFALTDHTGEPFQLAAQRGKNVLLVFYRGHW